MGIIYLKSIALYHTNTCINVQKHIPLHESQPEHKAQQERVLDPQLGPEDSPPRHTVVTTRTKFMNT